MGAALCTRKQETKTFGEDDTTANGGEEIPADHIFRLLLTGEPSNSLLFTK
jgi:hypothetical protein